MKIVVAVPQGHFAGNPRISNVATVELSDVESELIFVQSEFNRVGLENFGGGSRFRVYVSENPQIFGKKTSTSIFLIERKRRRFH